jgi:hypothetical protein
VPSGLVAPPIEALPETTLRRAPQGSSSGGDDDERVDDARRAFLFGRHATDAKPSEADDGQSGMAWSRTQPARTVWALVQELRALEGKPALEVLPESCAALPLPPDVQAVFAADSALLKARWQIDRARLSAHQARAAERGAPRMVRAFGAEPRGKDEADVRMLCAQRAGALGDRIGLFFGRGYEGPFPVETLLSETCWSIVESRSGVGNEDVDVERLATAFGRVLVERG